MSGGYTMAQDYIRVYTRDYMEKIFYFCLKKTGNQQEAEDLASDISLSVFAELRRGVIPTHFSAWVWQIARNRYSRWAETRHKRAERLFEIDIGEYELSDSKMTEDSYIRSEEIVLLRRELAFITSEYRNVLVAYYIEDKPIREIAKKLGLTMEAAKSASPAPAKYYEEEWIWRENLESEVTIRRRFAFAQAVANQAVCLGKQSTGKFLRTFCCRRAIIPLPLRNCP